MQIMSIDIEIYITTADLSEHWTSNVCRLSGSPTRRREQLFGDDAHFLSADGAVGFSDPSVTLE